MPEGRKGKALDGKGRSYTRKKRSVAGGRGGEKVAIQKKKRQFMNTGRGGEWGVDEPTIRGEKVSSEGGRKNPIT